MGLLPLDVLVRCASMRFPTLACCVVVVTAWCCRKLIDVQHRSDKSEQSQSQAFVGGTHLRHRTTTDLNQQGVWEQLRTAGGPGRLVVPLPYSRRVLLSSFLLGINGVAATLAELPLCAATAFLVMACSTNYWREPRNG